LRQKLNFVPGQDSGEFGQFTVYEFPALDGIPGSEGRINQLKELVDEHIYNENQRKLKREKLTRELNRL
jgi:hypothetical protein